LRTLFEEDCSFHGSANPKSLQYLMTSQSFFASLTATLILGLLGVLPAFAQGEKSILLTTLEEEVERAFSVLTEKGDPFPYFIGYDVTETRETEIVASVGALRESRQEFDRKLDADVRVGDYQLDNTRKLRGNRRAFSQFDYTPPIIIAN